MVDIFFAAVLAALSATSEPVCWNGGEWDFSGAPKGKLLTDNDGWWGRCVYTGVSYSYAQNPDAPRDQLRGNAEIFGRRLIDGDQATGWHKPVGMTKKRPLVVTFDFKRPCVFTEVDLLSSKSPQASAVLEVSVDGTNWTEFAKVECVAERTRIRPQSEGRGRHLRLSFRSTTSSSTYLDEVLVWGDGEVSPEHPENIVPIARGDALRMTERRNGGTVVVPLADPTEKSPVKTGMPPFDFTPCPDAGGEIVMARNETEVRYFAVVNESAAPTRVPLVAPDFGKGVSAQLLIGGLVRTQPPKYKLTEKQRFDLLLTGAEPEDAFDADKTGVIPFFSADMVPPVNFAKKYLANPEQVTGFPGAVEIAPGEGAVMMLRITTRNVGAGVRSGRLSAGKTQRDVRIRIVDVVLPENDAWIYVWSPFTRQFPFESRTRFLNDVRPIRELGATVLRGLPEKNSKVSLAAKNRGNAVINYRVNGVGKRVMNKTYAGKAKCLDDNDRRDIRERTEELRSKAAACGIRPDQLVLEISDEPGMRNAALFGEVCRYLREVAPDMSVYMNPSFWAKTRFTPTEDIIAALGGYYRECVDVSVPYRTLVEDEKGRKALWATKRRVNAQYAHPAHRAGRSIAWSSFRYGLNGFAYWAYYTPKGNPWDIRTWTLWAYECQLAFPLENGVALTPVYEEMREAYEDWLLLTALRRTGRKKLLAELLDEFAGSFVPNEKETSKPYACDFSALRLRALESFRNSR